MRTGMFNFFRKQPIHAEDPFRVKLPDSRKSFEEFSRNDVAIKIWLPEPVDTRLTELCDYFSESRPRLLRSVYFVYLYGRYEFEQMRIKSLGLFSSMGEPLFSQAPSQSVTHRSGPATTPELGKNDRDVKLWLPSKLRDDLQQIADKTKTPLSQLLREVLASTLFGHSYLPDRMQESRSPYADSARSKK